MSNLPPPEPGRSDRKIRDYDELIAIFVALTTIGAILFWGLGLGKDGFSLSKWQNFLSSDESEETARELPKLREEDSDGLEFTPQVPGVDSKLSKPKYETSRPALPRALVGLPLVATQLPKIKTEPTPPTSEVEPPKQVEAPPETPETPPEVPTKTVTEFTDVPEDYWARPFLEKLKEKEVITGFDDGTFRPEKPVTRADMAVQITEVFEPTVKESSISFPDLPTDPKAAKAIDKAVTMGFMQGYSQENAPNQFRPNQNIPRYQVLVSLARGLDLEPQKDVATTLAIYKDADRIPEWARERVAAATENGLAVNYPTLGNLLPNKPATRAEVAAMIHQALVKAGKMDKVDSKYIVSP